MELKGKVAMITGAAVGIGRATAVLMAREGAKLILLDLNEEKLNNLRQELSADCPDAVTVVCDVSNEQAVNDAVSKGVAKLGTVDILVNNAALWRCKTSFLDTPVEDWQKFMNINVMGVVHCTKAVLGGMLQQKWGRIINVASVAGVYGNANMVHYSATKGAVISMTKALAKEVAEQGVLVNAVSPGSVSPSDVEDYHHTQPSQLSFMGRTGSDMENAELICFLASDRASYISGQNIQIDGCRKKQ